VRHPFSYTAKFFFAALIVILTIAGSALAEQYAVIYRFKGTPDGGSPTGDLLSDSANNLYGTTSGGGTADLGTVYQLTPQSAGGVWTETVLYSFQTGTDGRSPVAGLVRDAAGNLYGTTFQGGTFGSGTVFELSPPATPGNPWTESILHNFAGDTDGANPECKLLLGKGGVLFGTTFSNTGTVFKLIPPAVPGAAWTNHTLYTFTGGSDGSSPWPGVISDEEGNLYGVTESGGLNGNGTAFELSPPAADGRKWTETTLHSFGPTEGMNPVGELMLDQSGNVYGMTSIGPATDGFGCGVVFQLVPPASQGESWTENLLYTFTVGRGGCDEYSGVVFDSQGNLLGANSGDGGLNGNGAIFELSPPAITGQAWAETTLHDFLGGNDGLYSYSTLITTGKGGFYYGATIEGGGDRDTGYGTVFEVKP
jgi:uncharacterized repeat protein (TIGR03803 family)